jgi:hypothetical protein
MSCPVVLIFACCFLYFSSDLYIAQKSIVFDPLTVYQVVENVQQEALDRQAKRIKDLFPTHVIKFPIDEEKIQAKLLDRPFTDIEGCTTACCRLKTYRDKDDAVRHLLQSHFRETKDKAPPSDDHLLPWIALSIDQRVEGRNAEIIKLLDILCSRIRRLLNKAIDIRQSVANKDNVKAPNYGLPTDLVKAGERILQYIYVAPHTIRFIHKVHRQDSYKNISRHRLESQLEENLSLIDYYGNLTDVILSKAQNEFYLMIHAGLPDNLATVHYIPISPEGILLGCLLKLLFQDVHNSQSPVPLYRGVLSRLVGTLIPTTTVIRLTVFSNIKQVKNHPRDFSGTSTSRKKK